MFAWLSTPEGLKAAGLIVLLIATAVLLVRTALYTDDFYHTVDAILYGRLTHENADQRLRPMTVVYGPLRLPVTATMTPRRMWVTIPAGRIPHVRDEEDANRIGQQIRDTYGFDSAETWQARGIRYWRFRR